MPAGRRRLLVGAALFAAGALTGAGGALLWAGQSRAFRSYLRQRSDAALEIGRAHV